MCNLFEVRLNSWYYENRKHKKKEKKKRSYKNKGKNLN